MMAKKRSVVNRRAFVTSGAAGLGLVLTHGLVSRAEAAEWSPAEKANVQIVNTFCAAFGERDFAKATAPLAENVTYRPIETAEPVKGREQVTARIKSFIGRAGRWDVLDTFAKGPMVVNERIDHINGGEFKSWHGVGVFFLRDGKIVDWYDYTIKMNK
jgi:limonene-1,2-epoxide hydrolase